MESVHAGLLDISPADIRRLAFYLVIRIYSSFTIAVPTPSTTTTLIIFAVKVSASQVTRQSTVVFDVQQGKLLHGILEILPIR